MQAVIEVMVKGKDVAQRTVGKRTWGPVHTEGSVPGTLQYKVPGLGRTIYDCHYHDYKFWQQCGMTGF